MRRYYVWRSVTEQRDASYVWFLSPGEVVLQTFNIASGVVKEDMSWNGNRDRIIQNMDSDWFIVPDNEIPDGLFPIIDSRLCVPEGL